MPLGVAIRYDRKTLLSLGVAILLGAVLLWGALRGVNFGELKRTLAGAHLGWFAAGCVAVSGSLFLRALRWRVLLTAETALPVSTAFWATSLGYLGNNVLPARMGELIRMAAIGWSAALSQSYVFATAVIERLMDAATLVLVMSLGLATVPGMPDWLKPAARGLSVLSLIGLALVVILPRIGLLLERILNSLPLPERLRTTLHAAMGNFLLGLRAFHHPGRVARFFTLTFVIWPMDAVAAMIVAHSLARDIAFPTTLIFLAALGLSSALPSTPGYVGIYQFVAVTVLAPFGWQRHEALALVLLYQAAIYLTVTLFGLLGLARLRRAPARPLTA